MDKKVLGLMLLLLGTGMVGAVITYPFFDGFESGSYTANWTSDGGTFTRQVTSATAAGGTYSFTMTGGASTHRTGVSASFAAAQTPSTVSFSLRSASTSTHDGYVTLGPSGSCAAFIFMRGTGYIYVNQDETFTYAANTWYNIRLELNWTSRTLTYYINGNLIKSNVAFIDQVSSFTTIYLYNYSTGSQAWWDNIDIGGGGGPVKPPRVIKDGWEFITSRYNGLESYASSHPVFADLDADGDLDLILGDVSGKLWYYRNNGQGSFSLADTSLGGVAVGQASAPAFADLDGDADLDLLVGKADGSLSYYRNDGTDSVPAFSLVDSNYFGIDAGTNSCPVFMDLDGDADLDLLVGKADGTVSFYRNEGTPQAAYWTLVSAFYDSISVGSHSTPSVVDLDNDADLDLLIGEAGGNLHFYRNDGTALAPAWNLVDANYFGIDAGSYSSPAWADLDGDADLDLFMGEASGGLVLFENQGTKASAYFAGQSPYDFALYAGANSAPLLADLDADGDLDLLIGGQDGTISHYRNDGTAGLPSWTLADTFYKGIDVGTYSVPTLADLDGDNDLDLFVGRYDGQISFYRNDGTAQAPAYTLVDSHYFNLDVGSSSCPVFADLDGDADLDLFIGNAAGTIYYYRNTGNRQSPYFTLASNYFDSIDVGSGSAPAFADLDGNGVLDLFVGSATGQVSLYFNNGTAQAADLVYITNNYAELTGGASSILTFGDLDGDDDVDLLVGRGDGYISYYNNVDAGTAPLWGQVQQNFLSIDVGSNSVPVFADIDGDADLDLFVGNYNGTICFYRNQGTPTMPACTLVTTLYDSIDKGTYSVPALVDMDGDGDLDLFVGGYDGTISLYRNDGTVLAPSWNLVDANYFNIDVGSYSAPAFVDIDDDNDYDLFIGNSAGTIYLYRNEGTATSPYWRQESTAYGGIDVGSNSVPAFYDIDFDGDYDLFVGNLDGTIYQYINDSTAQTARFVLESANFNYIDVGSNSAPTFADLDGDRDIGFFIGSYAGTITYWEMITPATAVTTPVERYRDRPVPRFTVFPNPVNHSATITLAGPEGKGLSEGITIYNGSGMVVNRLAAQGTAPVQWDGTDATGQRVEPGIYYIRIGGFIQEISVLGR